MTGAALACAALTAAAVAVLLAPADAGRLRRAVEPSSGSSRAGARAEGEGSDGGGDALTLVPSTAWLGGDSGRPGGRVPGPPAALAACLLAAAATALVLPWPTGPVLGAALGLVGPRLLARLEPRGERDERAQLLRDLPLTLDLLAACLAGGAGLAEAADAVGRAVGGPAGQRLLAVRALLAVGAQPGEAWGPLAGPVADRRAEDPFGPAARALARAADGGAPVAAVVARLATEARAEVRGRAEQAARRVGVLAVAPLGLCFLPAFVLLGIVPMVVSLAVPLLAPL